MLHSGLGYLPDEPPNWLKKDTGERYYFSLLGEASPCLRGPFKKRDEDPVLLITYHAFIQVMDDVQFIIVQYMRHNSDNPTHVRLTLYNLNYLNPMNEIPSQKELNESHDKIMVNGKAVCEVEIPISYERRTLTYPFPNEMHGAPEIILRLGPPKKSHIVLFCTDLSKQRIAIVPMMWYSEIDHLYEELIRFKRDPKDNNIVAKGWRL